jgi:hypothetical protein
MNTTVLDTLDTVIQTTPSAQAFKPANAMIKVGTVQLNQISPYLADLPNSAKAEFLISPDNTPYIELSGPRAITEWGRASDRTAAITEEHGLHFNGRFLSGMQISETNDVPYEKAWAAQVRAAWEASKQTGQNVVTGLGIGTQELLTGTRPERRVVPFPPTSGVERLKEAAGIPSTTGDNLFSKFDQVNAAIEAQGGRKIRQAYMYDYGAMRDKLLTSTELSGDLLGTAVFTSSKTQNGTTGIYNRNRDDHRTTSRPVALNVMPDYYPSI